MKNPVAKRIVPSYMKNFKCVGGSCEDTCCAGWCIEVDEATYKKYKKVKDKTMKIRFDKELVDRKNKATPEFAAKIKLKNNRCAFLSKEGWCDVYSQLGEPYLSNTCNLYPRTINKINDKIEYGLTFSCPEAARKILLEKEPITFEEEERFLKESTFSANLTVNESKPQKWQDYFIPIREMMIEIIQDRKIGFEERLLYLGGLMEELTKLSKQGQLNKIPDCLKHYKKELLENKPNQIADEIEEKKEISRLLGRLSAFKKEKKIPSIRYESCLNAAISSLGLEEDDKEQAYKTYVEGEQTFFKPLLKTQGYILENYVVNYIFERCIPLDAYLPIESYERMMLYYRMIKIHLIGMALDQKEISEDEVVKLIQSFTKTFDHNDECLRYFIKS